MIYRFIGALKINPEKFFEKLFSAAKSFGLHIFRLQVFSSFGRIREDWLPFIITFSEFKSAAWVSIADQASDRTSDGSLRNSNNSRQCGLDLRLGRSSRLSTCCCCLWPASPSSPQTPPSAFSPRGREKQPKNLLLHHLADPSGVRPPPSDNAYYQSLEITSAPASSPSALQDLLASLSHHLLAMSLKPPSLIN